MTDLPSVSSKSRPLVKHFIVFLFSMYLAYKAYINDEPYIYVFSGTLLFFILLEAGQFFLIKLKIENELLLIEKENYFGQKAKTTIFSFSEIYYTHYEYEKYERAGLWNRFFIEILFPSGQSSLKIVTTDMKTHEFLMNANKQQVTDFLKLLPERLPN